MFKQNSVRGLAYPLKYGDGAIIRTGKNLVGGRGLGQTWLLGITVPSYTVMCMKTFLNSLTNGTPAVYHHIFLKKTHFD